LRIEEEGENFRGDCWWRENGEQVPGERNVPENCGADFEWR
jgi:hypothetical protein